REPAPPATPQQRGDSAPSRPAKRLKAARDNKLLAGWQDLILRTKRHPQYATEYTRRFNTEGKTWKRTQRGSKPGALVLGLDCEMVYAKGDPNALARVSVVSFGGTLLDAYVHRLPGAILDYRTPISGVEAKHLTEENGATTFEAVQDKVRALPQSADQQ
ncbi:unnamed protein product, partial [Prorocentrum cordatum]